MHDVRRVGNLAMDVCTFVSQAIRLELQLFESLGEQFISKCAVELSGLRRVSNHEKRAINGDLCPIFVRADRF